MPVSNIISIVIPTHNRIDSLKRCIESIIPQSYPGLEVIIVNDYSSDSTNEYLETISRQYRFIRTITNCNNFGVNFSRNRGIEQASGKFILFLDSDDQLAHGCLSRIIHTINTNPEKKHFLFLVSDRKNEFKHVGAIKMIQYEDWIKASIGGDFTHVVLTDVMKRFNFFEQFRLYEHLNWLRVKKETSPQLLVPFVATERERGRADSLTSGARLKSLSVINAKFESQKLYYRLYYDDLKRFNPKFFTRQLLEVIMLGVACNKKRDCKDLIRYASKLRIKIAGSLILLLPGVIARKAIIAYSSLK